MKKHIIPALTMGFIVLSPVIAVQAGDYSVNYETKKDVVDWNAKKLEAQEKSTQMRKEKYEIYKAKGYDMSSMTPDLLDASQTDEGKFWNQMKIIINNFEMPMRKERIAEAQKLGIDTSMFTEEVMNDSGKFWDMWKKIIEPKKQEMMNAAGKPTWTESKKEGMKKDELVKPVQKQDESIKPVRALTENARKKFIKTLEAIPDEKRTTYREALTRKLAKQMEQAKKKNLKKTYEKLVEMNQLVNEYLGEDEVDDETMVDDILK